LKGDVLSVHPKAAPVCLGEEQTVTQKKIVTAPEIVKFSLLQKSPDKGPW
jgi:hypothetical protein